MASNRKFLATVDYEVACEMLAIQSGLLTTEIIAEEGKENPDQSKIEKLTAESQALWDEKVSLQPDAFQAIQSVFARYGKAHECQTLSIKEYGRVLQKLREKVFKHVVSSEHPEIFILGGQPGSGKSTLLPSLARGKDIVTINGDEFRSAHPNYHQMMEKDPEHMAELTDPEVRRWTKEIFDEAIERHFTIAFESTMRQDEPLCTTLLTLKKEGYRVTACVKAVHENDSWERCEKRYQRGLQATGYGRKVSRASHDEAYARMPLTLQRIEKGGLADEIRIYDLEGTEIPHSKNSAAEEVLAIREKRGQELAQEANHRV